MTHAPSQLGVTLVAAFKIWFEREGDSRIIKRKVVAK